MYMDVNKMEVQSCTTGQYLTTLLSLTQSRINEKK